MEPSITDDGQFVVYTSDDVFDRARVETSRAESLEEVRLADRGVLESGALAFPHADAIRLAPPSRSREAVRGSGSRFVASVVDLLRRRSWRSTGRVADRDAASVAAFGLDAPRFARALAGLGAAAAARIGPAASNSRAIIAKALGVFPAAS